jgi:hypothetical protein
MNTNVILNLLAGRCRSKKLLTLFQKPALAGKAGILKSLKMNDYSSCPAVPFVFIPACGWQTGARHGGRLMLAPACRQRQVRANIPKTLLN